MLSGPEYQKLSTLQLTGRLLRPILDDLFCQVVFYPRPVTNYLEISSP